MESQSSQNDLDYLFQTFGRALAHWSSVEHRCYVFYYALMSGANPHLISVNWHSIQSFDNKITLLDRCAMFAISRTAYADGWSPLVKRLRSASNERNIIAHSSIMSRVLEDGIPSPLYFGPSILDATAKIRGRLENSNHKYSAERLSDLAKKFETLVGDLVSFTETHFPQERVDFAY
nr:hypothetical protein RKHAN_02357 [Rhizobium sp. Khangiran2]